MATNNNKSVKKDIHEIWALPPTLPWAYSWLNRHHRTENEGFYSSLTLT